MTTTVLAEAARIGNPAVNISIFVAFVLITLFIVIRVFFNYT